MALRAATTFYWRGTGGTAYNASNNWVITGGGAPDADDYPGWDNSEPGNVDGDIVMFDAAITNAPGGGDYSAVGDLAAIKVSNLYNKHIASTATPLQVDMQATGQVLIDADAATPHIALKGGGANGLVNVTVLGVNLGSMLYLDGTIKGLLAVKGAITLRATADLSGGTMTVAYHTSIFSDVTLTITAGAVLPAIVQVLGGTTTCNVACTTLNMDGGLWTQVAGNVTLLNLTGATAEFRWNAGNITTAHAFGILNASLSATLRTCTTLYQYAGSQVNINNSLKGITITTWHFMVENPNLRVVPGQTIAIAG